MIISPDDPVYPQIEKTIESSKELLRGRLAAVDEIAKTGGKEAFDSLVKILKTSPSWRVRTYAARLLKDGWGDEAVWPLIKALRGDYKDVYFDDDCAFDSIGAMVSMNYMNSAQSKTVQTDIKCGCAEEGIRFFAATYLEEFNAPIIKETFILLVTKFLSRKNDYLREIAVRTLAQYPDADTIKLLEEISETDPSELVREEAKRSLQMIKNED